MTYVLPTHHTIAATTMMLPLARRGWSLIALTSFLGAAVLIDVDHYLGYAWQTGDFSLRRAYAFHRRRHRHPLRWRFHPHWPVLGFETGRVFHSVPVLLALWAAATRWPQLRPIAGGALFHRLQDEAWSYLE